MNYLKKGIKVDLVLTDPPYGTTRCKWDSTIPFDKMWLQVNKLITDTTPILLFGSEPFSSNLRMSNIKNFKYDWIWNKQRGSDFLNAKRKPLYSYEIISVFYNKQCLYNPQYWQGKPYNKSWCKHSNIQVYGKSKGVFSESKDEKRYPLNIITANKTSNQFHPTEKPIELLEYLIKTYTNEGDLVLDFTIGSGSAGVACVNTNRNFIGIELDKNYFNIAKNRIEDAKININ